MFAIHSSISYHIRKNNSELQEMFTNCFSFINPSLFLNIQIVHVFFFIQFNSTFASSDLWKVISETTVIHNPCKRNISLKW